MTTRAEASSPCPARSGKQCGYNCGDACLLLPALWEAQRQDAGQAHREEVLAPIREAHDWQCDCTPDDPCRILIALDGGPSWPGGAS